MSGVPTEAEVRKLKDAAWMRAWNDREWAAWHAVAESWLAQRDVVAAAQQLNEWTNRMPDAGFNSDSPRWAWWSEGAAIRQRVSEAVAAVVSGTPEQENDN